MRSLWFVVGCVLLVLTGCGQRSDHSTGSDQFAITAQAGGEAYKHTRPIVSSDNTTIQYDGAISYMDDQGMVTYDRTTHTTLQSITSADTPAVQYKQLFMSIDGGSLRLRDVADQLADRINPIHTSITIEDNDIILRPDFTNAKKPQDTLDGLSYITIDAGEQSYRIRGESSRWSDSFFVIPATDQTLIKIDRNPPSPRAEVHHKDTLLHELYLGREGGIESPLSITKNKKITLSIDDANTTTDADDETLIYHVEFGDGLDGGDSCLTKMKNTLVSLATLQNYMKTQNIHLASCKRIRPSNNTRTLTTTNTYRQGLLTMVPGGLTIVPLNHDVYDVTAKPHYDASAYGDSGQYKIAFDTPFLLDQESLLTQCKKIRPHCTYRSYTKELIIEPVPGVQYDETWTIQNIFGQKVDVDRSYSIDQIDPAVTRQEVISNTSINILPRDGDFSDVLVQYRNVPSFAMTITPCTVGQQFTTDQGYLGKGAENYMFQCQGAGEVVQIAPQLTGDAGFTYRKTYRTAVPIPTTIQKNQAFALQFTDLKGKQHAHYVAYSDIALWTKMTESDLLLRAQYYADGRRVSGTYTVRNIAGTVLATGPIAKTGPTRIDVGSVQHIRDRDGLLVTVTDDQDSEGRLIAHRGGYDNIYTKHTSIGDNRGLTIDSRVDPYDIVSSSSNIKFWGKIPDRKIYAYPARGIYKPGDTVHIAGYIRNMKPNTTQSPYTSQKVFVRLEAPHTEASNQNITLTPDAFGGFTGSFVLPQGADLGSYVVSYELGDNYYSHNIEVQEYTKPTFSPNATTVDQDGLKLRVDPRYFFGEDVASYDVQIARSVGGGDEGCDYRCGRWSDEDSYKNTLLGDMTTTGGTITIHDQSDAAEHIILSADDLDELLPGREVKITATVRDLTTSEVQHQTLYHKSGDDLAITLQGRLYEWLYRDGSGTDPRTTKEIRGSITDTKNRIDRLEYSIYYRSYDMKTQKGVDGSTYYIRKEPYQRIDGGRLRQSGDDFVLPVGFIDQPGSYVVSVQGYQGDKLIAQNDKFISRYFRQDGRDILGSVPNNHTLTVQPTKPTYTIDDGHIELDLVPYPRGSQAIITVEQGQYVLDTIETTLDGTSLRIPIDQSYIPSVTLSVMLLQPTNLSTSQRKEPRFYAGYASVDIDTTPQKLTISITPQQKTYRPGEDVTLDIMTTDHTGKPVDARVSIAVVDKALTYLYDRTKEPLKEFFAKIGTSVTSYTNMKLLYQSLKAFANDGSKGGSGVGGESMFQYIRDNLIDEAYRNPAIYTRNGSASVTFTLPDNMTTRLVDAVAITADTKLGTTSAEFTTSKDVIIEGYMPRFLSLGDEIQVPYKIITPDADESHSLSGRVWITDTSGKRTHEITTRTHDTKVESVTVPLSFPDEWRQLPSIQVHHEVRYGDDTDHIVQTVPLRTQGLMRHVGASQRSSEGALTLKLPAHNHADIAVHASTAPTDSILPSIRSQLWTDSTHYAGVVIDQIAALHHLTQRSTMSQTTLDRYRDGRVLIDNTRYNIDDRLDVLIGSLASLQEVNGGIRSSQKRSSTIETMYHRSLKAYLVLLPLHQSRPSPQTKTIIRQLEKFLSAYRADYPQARQLVLVTSAIYGGDLAGTERVQVSESGYDAIVDYLRAMTDDSLQMTDSMRTLATVPTNGKDDTGYGYGSTLLATALLTQAIHHDDTPDHKLTNQLQSLIALTQDEAVGRGYGGLGSLYARQTMIDSWKMLTPGQATCTYTIDGVTLSTPITPGESFSTSLTTEKRKPSLSRSCDKPTIWQMTASYMPATHDSGHDTTSDHLTHMQQSMDITSQDTYENIISRATDVAGLETMVSIHIPSTMIHTQAQKLIESITYSDSHCRPDHVEVRYDRVDLFYDTLDPGTCDITYPIYPGYGGSARVMPLQIREATRGLIRGSKTMKPGQ